MSDTLIDKLQAAEWAQETTLKKLLDQANVSNDFLKEFLKTQNVNQSQLDAIRAGTRATQAQTTANVTSSTSLSSKLSGSLNQVGNTISGSVSGISKQLKYGQFNLTKQLGSAAGGLANALSSTSSSFGPLNVLLNPLTIGLTSFSWAVEEGFHIIKDLNESFSELYDRGINLSGGLEGLALYSESLGLSTADTTKVLTNFSTTVAYLGTVRTGQLIKQFKELTKNGSEFGYTNEQAAEAVLDYAEILRNSGILTKITDQALTSSAKEFNLQLTEAAEITGKSRKELEKQMKAEAARPDISAMERDITSRIGTRATTVLTDTVRPMLSQLGDVGGEIYEAVLSQLSGTPIAPEILKSLNFSGLMTDVNALTDSIRSGKTSTENFNSILDSASNSIMSRTSNELVALQNYGKEYSKYASSQLKSQQEIMQREQARAKINEEIQSRIAILQTQGMSFESAKAIATKEREAKLVAQHNKELATQNTLQAASSKLNDVFQALVVDVLRPMLPVFELLGDGVIKVSDFIGNWLVPGLSKFSNFITDTFGPVFTTLSDHFNRYLMPSLDQLSKFFTDFLIPTLSPAISSLGNLFMKTAQLLDVVFGDSLIRTGRLISDTFLYLLPLIKPIISGLATSITWTADALTQLVELINTYVVPVFLDIFKYLSDVGRTIGEIYVGLTKRLSWLFSSSEKKEESTNVPPKKEETKTITSKQEEIKVFATEKKEKAEKTKQPNIEVNVLPSPEPPKPIRVINLTPPPEPKPVENTKVINPILEPKPVEKPKVTNIPPVLPEPKPVEKPKVTNIPPAPEPTIKTFNIGGRFPGADARNENNVFDMLNERKSLSSNISKLLNPPEKQEKTTTATNEDSKSMMLEDIESNNKKLFQYYENQKIASSNTISLLQEMIVKLTDLTDATKTQTSAVTSSISKSSSTLI